MSKLAQCQWNKSLSNVAFVPATFDFFFFFFLIKKKVKRGRYKWYRKTKITFWLKQLNFQPIVSCTKLVDVCAEKDIKRFATIFVRFYFNF